MNRKHTLLIFPVVLGLLLSACSEQEKSDKASTDSATSSTSNAAGTDSASTTKTSSGTTIAVTPELVAQGKQLYDQNCSVCHQADAIGKPGFAPSLTNQEFLSVSSDQFILGTIRDGRAGTGMPPFAHLGRQPIEAIVAYLRSHATIPNIAATVDAQPSSKGDERLGKFWFDSICATCHGPDGDGYASGGTGTAIGKASFLDKASDGFIRVTIKKGRSNTRMIGYQGTGSMAELSDKEIDDIIKYLRTVPSKS